MTCLRLVPDSTTITKINLPASIITPPLSAFCSPRRDRADHPYRKGAYRCLLCDHVLEVFDGLTEVAIRLTVQPEKTFE
jgi:hypothetical protein